MFATPLSLAIHNKGLSFSNKQLAMRILSSPEVWGTERQPFRHLDLAASCHFADVHPLIKIDDILKVSALAVPPVPTVATNEAFYALTHCAFYTFDYASLKKNKIFNTENLYSSIEGGACRCLVDNDFDLGLELVATSSLLGIPFGPAQRFIIKKTCQYISECGKIPCFPSEAASRFMKFHPKENWAHEFHTMLVAAITLTILILNKNNILEEIEPCDHLFSQLIGEAFSKSKSYDLEKVANIGNNIIDLFELNEREYNLIKFLADFILISDNFDGTYGKLIDEHHLESSPTSKKYFNSSEIFKNFLKKFDDLKS